MNHAAPRPLVLQTEHLSPEPALWLAERADLVACDPNDTASVERYLLDAQGLVVRTYTQVDAALLDRATNLRVVGRAGVGLDNIDVAACRERNVEVVFTPDANTQAVVEYVTLLMLDAVRPRATVTAAPLSVDWKDLRATTVGARQLNELTVGILGLGRIGSRIAQVVRAIGADVVYHDIADVESELPSVDASTLFARCDILTIHIDGRASNARFVGEDLLSKMKSDALLINTSRGFVIDSSALADQMRLHPNRRAILDVHDPEPFDETYPLLGLNNVVLAPHLASRTETAMNNMSWVVRDVWAALNGEPVMYPAP